MNDFSCSEYLMLIGWSMVVFSVCSLLNIREGKSWHGDGWKP